MKKFPISAAHALCRLVEAVEQAVGDRERREDRRLAELEQHDRQREQYDGMTVNTTNAAPPTGNLVPAGALPRRSGVHGVTRRLVGAHRLECAPITRLLRRDREAPGRDREVPGERSGNSSVGPCVRSAALPKLQ